MSALRVGVIGLGSMGRGIAKNLVTKGFPTTVYDANLAAIEPLQMLGAEGAETPRAVAERSDVVVTVSSGARAGGPRCRGRRARW